MPAPIVSLQEDPRGLFGPIYTFDEWEVAFEEEERRKLEEKEARTANILGSNGAKPDHWPEDTEPDTAKWGFWLPEGWGQGMKTTISGKPLKCFIGPPGSNPKTGLAMRIFHKPEVEKFVGYTFKTKEEHEAEAGKEEKVNQVRSVHDTLPVWPGQGSKKEEDWLPHDWCIGYRQLPTALHRIYLPPGQREGFLWHRTCVQEWLQGNEKKMASIENSQKMENIMVTGRADRPDLPKAKMKKRRLNGGDEHRLATDESYASCPRLTGCNVGALDDSSCPAEARADLRRQEESYREFLGQRGFTDIDFMAFFLRDLEEKEEETVNVGADQYGKVVDRLLGLFYHMTELNGRPCYHQIRTTEGGASCTGLYLYWSPVRAAWKLSGQFSDKAAGYAVFPCGEADQTTNLVFGEGRGWTVLRQDFFSRCEQPAQPVEPGPPSASAADS